MNNGLFVRATTLILALAVLGGCDKFAKGKKDLDKDDEADSKRREFPIHIEGTVSQYANLLGRGRLMVHGYGLVIGLGKDGSSEVPPHLREYLIQNLLKQKVGMTSEGMGHISPSRIINDLDTAVVYVRAALPAASPEGTRFDAAVSAFPTTNTKSLDGGILMPTELRLDVGHFKPGEGSKVWAIAGGPVMVNPFVDVTDPQDAVQLREGMVVGGGQAARPRSVSLQLYRADYSRADQLQRRINDRFPGAKSVANAVNSSLIEIEIPKPAQKDYGYFLQLIMRLPLRSGPGDWELHVREVVEEMRKDDAAHEDLALVLEAHGRKVVGQLSTLYDSPVEGAAFYAARTGVRLGDRGADEIITRFARQSGDAYQLAAIEALGRQPKIARSESVLLELLNAENDMVRIAAWESLRQRRSRKVTTIKIGGQFEVDIVPTTQEPLVYATRTMNPRIVLFGKDLRITQPVYFSMPNDLVVINANGDDQKITIWRSLPGRDRTSEPFTVMPGLPNVISTLGDRPERNLDGSIRGMGLTYGQIVALLYRLCEQGHIPARFHLQVAPEEHNLIRKVKEAGAPEVEESASPDIEGS